ncbi:phage nozzle protein [Roseibium alexandrii]|uniref:Tail tubular protein B n=1 Tax=Roseibium alexandrii (strain DSM 17067 / NCIMB 14079 / DFL-11) TaxID=244592 RepID=A0A5E8GT11_ROSAD|nr:hypothetical protein [Roseibium alexandrii]EEE42857.1 hypothetical protein SADFL11_PLAS29 [Roseibium alexandrii DFL-11]
MGVLTDQSIKTFFNGISRQPSNVRLPSQHEAADNVLFSVVSGGFEGRPCMQMIAALTDVDSSLDWTMHIMDRDENERYAILISENGDLKVFDLIDGTEQTVQAYDADVQTYLSQIPENLSFVTVADYTFVVNRTTEVVMDPSKTAPGTFRDSVQLFSDLPGSATDGDVYRISNGASPLDDYYVKYVSADTEWVECAKPGEVIGFDAKTMPHQIVREEDGSFSVSRVEWSDRQVGDAESVKDPSFVGRAFKDIFFFKNRLGFVSDENTFFSQAADFFNLWPDQANVVGDSDPVDIAASTTKVTILQWVVPFRRALFLSADLAQFELASSDFMTPTSVAVDLATSYEATNLCRPTTLGDELYFAAEKQGKTVIYEYFYDDDTLSNTAIDVTKHAEGYIPGRVYLMEGSAIANTLLCVADGDSASMYTYRVFWNGQEKIQSAWSRWTFDNSYIDGVKVINDTAYVLVTHNDTLCLTKIPLEQEAIDEGLGFDVKLDWREELSGVYDAQTDRTTFTVSQPHDDEYQVILGGEWVEGLKGRLLQVTYPTSTTIEVVGDFSAHPVYVGKNYKQRVELSRIFMRDQSNAAMISGRLQLKDIQFSFTNSGYFEVHVTPQQRDKRIVKMTGRQIGTPSNAVGTVPILTGKISAPVKSRGDTTRIEIINETHLPMIVNSAVWRGFYNEISKQG